MRFRHVQLRMDCQINHQWYNILLSSMGQQHEGTNQMLIPKCNCML